MGLWSLKVRKLAPVNPSGVVSTWDTSLMPIPDPLQATGSQEGPGDSILRLLMQSSHGKWCDSGGLPTCWLLSFLLYVPDPYSFLLPFE